MPSTYSTNLKIELQGTGENAGTWGTITNTNLGTALEQAIVGYGNPIFTSDANLTLTYTDTNAAQAARALVLNVTSSVSLTATRQLIVPTIQKQYIVQNNTTGSQSITVKTSAGTGITVSAGRKAHLYVDGTNVIFMDDFVDINGGTIDGTTQATGTINGPIAAGGTWTAAATWTLPAHTLGGTVTSNGQSFSGTIANLGTVTTADINGGTLDGTVIGGASAAAATVTTLSATGVATFSAGTVSAPAITTSGDTNTGIFFPAADTIAFAEGGAEALRIDSSANVGIGTASPAVKLEVLRGSEGEYLRAGGDDTGNNGRGLRFTSSTNGGFIGAKHTLNAPSAGGAIAFATASTERAVIDSSGNLGIGTSSPLQQLHLSSASATGMQITYQGVGAARIGVAAGNLLNFGLDTSNGATTRMTLDSSGNLGIATTSPAAKLDVNGAGVVRGFLTTTDAIKLGGNTSAPATTDAFIYRPADNTLAFGTASSERARIASDGRVSIGSTSSNAMLYINGAATDEGLRIEGTGSPFLSIWDSGTRDFYLEDAAGSINVWGTTSKAMAFGTNNAERARIHSGGGITVGGTTDDGILTSVQTISTIVQFSLRDNTNTRRAIFLGSGYYGYQWAQIIYADGGKAYTFANAAGTESGSIVINNASVAYNTTSDYRLKDQQKPLIGSGAFIDAIKPKEWVWKNSGERGVGFIAHELAEVSPSSVSGEKDAVGLDMVQDENGEYVEKTVPKYQSVSYSSGEIIANLVAEIQSLRARVAALEAK